MTGKHVEDRTGDSESKWALYIKTTLIRSFTLSTHILVSLVVAFIVTKSSMQWSQGTELSMTIQRFAICELQSPSIQQSMTPGIIVAIKSVGNRRFSGTS